jgi:hypothetical protein
VTFRQVVEFSTSRIDDVYLLTVEFSSHEQAMGNSVRPRTGEFARFLGTITDGDLTLRNLDVVREDDLWMPPPPDAQDGTIWARRYRSAASGSWAGR